MYCLAQDDCNVFTFDIINGFVKFSCRDATKREASFEDWFHVVKRAISAQHVYKLDDRELSYVIFASLDKLLLINIIFCGFSPIYFYIIC